MRHASVFINFANVIFISAPESKLASSSRCGCHLDSPYLIKNSRIFFHYKNVCQIIIPLRRFVAFGICCHRCLVRDGLYHFAESLLSLCWVSAEFFLWLIWAFTEPLLSIYWEHTIMRWQYINNSYYYLCKKTQCLCLNGIHRSSVHTTEDNRTALKVVKLERVKKKP